MLHYNTSVSLFVFSLIKSFILFFLIVLTLVKMLLEAAGAHVSEVVSETKQEADEEIRTRIIADAQKMLSDYQTIEGILKKHGV